MDSKPTRGRPKGTSAKHEIRVIVNATWPGFASEVSRNTFLQPARAQKFVDMFTTKNDVVFLYVFERGTNREVARTEFKGASRFNVAEWVNQTLSSQAQ